MIAWFAVGSLFACLGMIVGGLLGTWFARRNTALDKLR